MDTDLTFNHLGTGPAGGRAGRVPSLPMNAIHAMLKLVIRYKERY